MAVTFSVKGGIDSVIADLGKQKREVVDIALPRALNKMVDQVKTGSARGMRDAGYNLKVSDIKKGLTVIRASSGRLVATVRASGRPIPLVAYGARSTAKGVSVSVLHGRKVITHAFIATMPSGHKGVFIRVGDQHKKVNRKGGTVWSALPIKELFGPSVPDGLANKAVQETLQRLVDEKFPDILRAQFKRVTS